MAKKNAQPHKNAELSANHSGNSTKPVVLTPRQKRLMAALAQATDWIYREAVDRITGASNGPQIVMEVRRKVTGGDHLRMEQGDSVDRDGRACKPGRYKLTEEGRELVLKALASANGGAE